MSFPTSETNVVNAINKSHNKLAFREFNPSLLVLLLREGPGIAKRNPPQAIAQGGLLSEYGKVLEAGFDDYLAA